MAKRAHDVVEEKLTVAAVARRIGVAPATLRTWDRRYDLGPSEHREGEHRRYCPADLAKLTIMRRLIVAEANGFEFCRFDFELGGRRSFWETAKVGPYASNIVLPASSSWAFTSFRLDQLGHARAPCLHRCYMVSSCAA
jgi:transposase-like protein